MLRDFADLIRLDVLFMSMVRQTYRVRVMAAVSPLLQCDATADDPRRRT